MAEITENFPDIFTPEATADLWARLDKLTPETPALWGKMRVDQMLAHACTPYEQALGHRNDGPNPVMKLMLRLFYKKPMTNTKPYSRNLPTAPSFIVADRREFEKEKARLKDLIQQTEKKGKDFFNGKKQLTLGALNVEEWNNLLYKHTDHHLRQFGV
ncbi:MAG: hypothetical protein JNL57_04360 [Bacteroidetes bacterium]|nr:hypothetical protein [Bacteroidota bacterium]